MSNTPSQKAFMRIILLLVALVLHGCGTDSNNVVSPGSEAKSQMTDERLIFRHGERWAAVIAADFDLVYEYATPEYRAIYSKTHLHNQYATQIKRKAATVANIRRDESDPSIAYVKTELTFQTLLPDGGNIYQDQVLLDETWRFSEGDWWFVEPR